MFEIRNYHFEPTRFDAYKKWAEALAVPFIRGRWDFVGFWLDNGMAPEYSGSLPLDEDVRPGKHHLDSAVAGQGATRRGVGGI